jgi:hypothetical protein
MYNFKDFLLRDQILLRVGNVTNVSEVTSLPEQSLGMCWTDSGWTNRTISKASSLEFKPNKTYKNELGFQNVNSELNANLRKYLMLWKLIFDRIEVPKYAYSTVWKINPKHKEKYEKGSKIFFF